MAIYKISAQETYCKYYNALRTFFLVCHAIFLQDPRLYVRTILNVHTKYNNLVSTAFKNDSGFVAALDKVNFLKRFFLILSLICFVT